MNQFFQENQKYGFFKAKDMIFLPCEKRFYDSAIY